MSEEEKKAAEEAKALEDAKKANEGDDGVNKDNEDKKSLLEEVKKLRTERATYKELLDAKMKQEEESKQGEGKTDVEIAVEGVLREKELSRAKANKIAALAKFVTENKEFSEDNDPAGIKRRALETKFSAFNTDGLIEVEDFVSVIKDAHSLLVGVDKQPEFTRVNPYSNSSPDKSGAGDGLKKLSESEQKLCKEFGYSEEKLLNLKNKRPDFLEDLLSYVR
jgi:hypothetical protein